MNSNENDLWRKKTELLYLISKLARAKVLLKLEFDAEDQVLFCILKLSYIDYIDFDSSQGTPCSCWGRGCHYEMDNNGPKYHLKGYFISPSFNS